MALHCAIPLNAWLFTVFNPGNIVVGAPAAATGPTQANRVTYLPAAFLVIIGAFIGHCHCTGAFSAQQGMHDIVRTFMSEGHREVRTGQAHVLKTLLFRGRAHPEGGLRGCSGVVVRTPRLALHGAGQPRRPLVRQHRLRARTLVAELGFFWGFQGSGFRVHADTASNAARQPGHGPWAWHESVTSRAGCTSRTHQRMVSG